VTRCDGQWAYVEVTRSAMCENCSESKSCIILLDSGKKMVAVVDNELGARVGDLVEITISEGVIFWGAVIIYAIPLCALLFSIILALYLNRALGWNKSENALVLGAGFLGIILSLPLVRVISKRWKYLSRGRPRITGILQPEDESR
jgi:positive regulator of sigma E activity